MAGDPKAKLPGRLTVAAGGILAVGAMLPWIKASAPVVGTVNRSGVDGDGVITLGAGLLVGLLGLGVLRSPSGANFWAVAVVLGFAAGGIAVYDWTDISRTIDAVDPRMVTASVGEGIYVTVAGAVLAIGAGFGLKVVRDTTVVDDQAPVEPPGEEPAEEAPGA